MNNRARDTYKATRPTKQSEDGQVPRPALGPRRSLLREHQGAALILRYDTNYVVVAPLLQHTIYVVVRYNYVLVQYTTI